MQVDQEGQGEQPTEEERLNNSGSKVQFILKYRFPHAVYCYFNKVVISCIYII